MTDSMTQWLSIIYSLIDVASLLLSLSSYRFPIFKLTVNPEIRLHYKKYTRNVKYLSSSTSLLILRDYFVLYLDSVKTIGVLLLSYIQKGKKRFYSISFFWRNTSLTLITI